VRHPDVTAIASPTAEERADARRRLSLGEKGRLAWEVVGTYVRARILLRRYQLGDAVQALRAGASPAEPTGFQLLQGVRLARIVRRTLGALPADSRCLVQSLVLTALLARRGVETTVVVGVKSDPSFEAHAWVEFEGYPLLSPGDGGYGRLLEL
jgi:hypothetical protein